MEDGAPGDMTYNDTYSVTNKGTKHGPDGQLGQSIICIDGAESRG